MNRKNIVCIVTFVAIIILTVFAMIMFDVLANQSWYKVLKDSPLATLGSIASVFGVAITLLVWWQVVLQAEITKKQIAAEQFKNAIAIWEVRSKPSFLVVSMPCTILR